MVRLKVWALMLMVAMTTASGEQLGFLLDLPSLDTVLIKSANYTGKLDVSDTCFDHFSYYVQSLIVAAQRKTWAVTMFDASTKVPDSVVSGAFVHVGNFDQCIGVRGERDGETLFRAQYCGTTYTISNLPLTLATCVPGSCTPQEIQTILQAGMELLTSEVSVSINPENCYTGEDLLPVDAKAAVMMSVFVLLLLIVVIATIFDFYGTKNDSRACLCLLSFSLRSNLPSLVSTKHAPNSIKCLHGLRVLSLFWIMLGHRFAGNTFPPLLNTVDLTKQIEDTIYSVITNSFLGVDTFFFLSGFLVCYVFMLEVTRSNSFNLIKFYVYRYIRLTPPYALLIGFYVCLFRMTGYGPRWRSTLNWQMKHCDKYWWINLIYLTNYLRLDNDNYDPAHPDADCVDQGWYLTVDMQLAWLAPLVLVPLWRWPRYTLRVGLPLLVLASCFTPFAITYIEKFPMLTDFRATPLQVREFVTKMYWPTHNRATPYLGGMILAYFLFKYRQHRFDIPKVWVCAGWLLCTALSLTLLFSTAIMYDPQHKYDDVEAAFYAGFHRLAWSAALAWIVFACHTGYGGFINEILSWRTLLPISRLSYSMFITHYILIFFDVGQSRSIEYYGKFNNTQCFLSDLVIVGVIIAPILYLCCEAPSLKLLRMFFKPDTTKKAASDAKEKA